jgi:hypothetical protein
MPDMLRQIVYPTFVFVLIASVWALGWEKSHSDAVEQGLAPPAEARNTWLVDDESPAGRDDPPGPISATSFDYE